jgi:long-chain acyl-CoA synthetase
MIKSLPQMLRERVQLIPSTVAQYVKDDTGRFQSKTYWEFYCEICDTAAGLLELGVKRGDHIGLISDNRQEWLVSDFAVMTIGAADVPRGCDSTEQEVAYILGFTDCAFSFAEDSKQIDKILAYKENMPLLNTVIAYDPIDEKTLVAAGKAGVRVIPFRKILAMGKKRQAEKPGEVEAEMDKGQEEDLATIIFTAGTAGEPK